MDSGDEPWLAPTAVFVTPKTAGNERQHTTHEQAARREARQAPRWDTEMRRTSGLPNAIFLLSILQHEDVSVCSVSIARTLREGSGDLPYEEGYEKQVGGVVEAEY
jgi:hypothetical protein